MRFTETMLESKDDLEDGERDFTTLRGSKKGDLVLTNCSVGSWK